MLVFAGLCVILVYACLSVCTSFLEGWEENGESPHSPIICEIYKHDRDSLGAISVAIKKHIETGLAYSKCALVGAVQFKHSEAQDTTVFFNWHHQQNASKEKIGSSPRTDRIVCFSR